LHWKLRRAADPRKSCLISLHLWIVSKPIADFAKDPGGVCIGRFDESIVHPFTFTTSRNETSTAQVGQMPRNFWLIRLQDFNKETNANLVVSDQVYDSQSSTICKSLKKQFDAVVFVCHQLSIVNTTPFGFEFLAA
jgi:hypothetical protein